MSQYFVTPSTYAGSSRQRASKLSTVSMFAGEFHMLGDDANADRDKEGVNSWLEHEFWLRA